MRHAESDAIAVAASPGSPDTLLAMSLKQPAWHVLLLGVLSCKLYLVYWCYKTWRDLSRHIDEVERTTDVVEPGRAQVTVIDAETGKAGWRNKVLDYMPARLSSFRRCNAGLRALATCVPFLNDYLFLTIARGVAQLQPKNSPIARHAALFAGGATVFSMITTLFASQKGALYLLSFVSILPFALVQHLLNKYWDTKEPPGLIFRAGFSFNEIVLIILGGLLFGFIIAGFIMGANPA